MQNNITNILFCIFQAACQKVLGTFLTSWLKNCKIDICNFILQFLSLRRVIEREREPWRFPFTLSFPPKSSAWQVFDSLDGRHIEWCTLRCFPSLKYEAVPFLEKQEWHCYCKEKTRTSEMRSWRKLFVFSPVYLTGSGSKTENEIHALDGKQKKRGLSK